MRFLNTVGHKIREQGRRADGGGFTYSLATIHVAAQTMMSRAFSNGELTPTATSDCPSYFHFYRNANRFYHRPKPPFFGRVANADTFARGYQPASSDLDKLLKNKRPAQSYKGLAGADRSTVDIQSAKFDKTQPFGYNQNIRNEGLLFSFASRQPHTAPTVGAFHFSEKPHVVVATSNFSTHYESLQTSTAIYKTDAIGLSIHGVKPMFARTYFQIARPTLHAPDAATPHPRAGSGNRAGTSRKSASVPPPRG